MRMYDKDESGSGTRNQQFWGFADPPRVTRLTDKVIASGPRSLAPYA
jgi:hypothetical protein